MIKKKKSLPPFLENGHRQTFYGLVPSRPLQLSYNCTLLYYVFLRGTRTVVPGLYVPNVSRANVQTARHTSKPIANKDLKKM